MVDTFSLRVKKFSTCVSLIMVVYELSVPDDSSNVHYVFVPLMQILWNIVFKGTCSLLHRCNWDMYSLLVVQLNLGFNVEIFV